MSSPSSSLKPRVVIIERETELSALITRLGTRGQVAFYLERRGQSLDLIEQRDRAQRVAIEAVKAAIPGEWSFARVLRDDLDRFLFFPNDIVVAVGQDGLVANLAKYLDGQPVIGVTPDPEISEGVLSRHPVAGIDKLLIRAAARDADFERRTMVEARLGSGQNLIALNDLFIGHRSHQSARYELSFGGEVEFQSSSGIVVATGTGLSGWARSIMRATGTEVSFGAEADQAAFFAREPWPSRLSGDRLRSGMIEGNTRLTVTSRINDGGVIFADGIEQDFLGFDWGTRVEARVAEKRLMMVG